MLLFPGLDIRAICPSRGSSRRTDQQRRHHEYKAGIRVKVDYAPRDDNDLATPATEITSRHRVDKRSLLPRRRVIPEGGMPPGASQTSKSAPALGLTEVARAGVLDHDAAPTDLSCATWPIGCRTEVREGKTSPFCRWG